MQTAKEAAEAAAKAVQEAEIANGLANELIAKADRYDRETPTDDPLKEEEHPDTGLREDPPFRDDPTYKDDPDFQGE